jgi:hypothetical protein
MHAISIKKRWFGKNIRADVFDDVEESPMPSEDGPLPAKGPRLPKPFPPDGWAADIGAFARGEKSKIGSAEKDQVKADLARFTKALDADDQDQRAANMLNALEDQLSSSYKGKVAKRTKGSTQHPAEARIQRAHLALESLLVAAKGFPAAADRKVLLRAVHALSPEQQADLLRADEGSGRRLYSAVYEASKEDPQLEEKFQKVKAAAQLARVGSRLDAHDPSGETNELVNGVLRHLGKGQLDTEELNAFASKLNFKLTIQPGQAEQPDLPLPDTSKPGWREKFTARTLSLLAETPAVSDESIEKALEMPEGDLVKVLSHAYMGPRDDSPRDNPDMVRREGDMRLARVARAQAAKKDPTLHALLEGLESNYLNRRRMLEEAQKGTPVKRILETLEAEAAEDATKLAEQGKAKLEKRRTNFAGRKSENDDQIRDVKEDIRKAREVKPIPDQELIDSLVRKQKRLERAQEKLAQAKTIMDNVAPPTAEQTLLLMKRFGRFALKNLRDDLGAQTVPTLETLVNDAEAYRQIAVQVAAAENPKLLKQGLNKSSYVLPTAGKPLKSCPWLQSTAEDLVRIATAIRVVETDFTLKNNPIIVLDQTDGNGTDVKKTQLWQENDDYLKKLEKEYEEVGLTIKHISMANIKGVMQGSGVEKLFDTTGEGNAGYGGARNMAFLLGPVIQDAVRKGQDPTTIQPAELAKRIKDTALTDAPKLFMGDDTDYVAPGGVASKAALAVSDRHADEYSLIATSRYGRDTQGVSSAFANCAVDQLKKGGLDEFTTALFASNKWNTKNTVPGMGCTFGEPRFCLDLPTGAEEKQCEGSVFTSDHFGQASHLSGDRQAPPSAFLKSYMAYSNMTETVKALFDVGELPWNAEATKRKTEGAKPFNNLDEVLSQAADPEKRKAMQKSMLTKLAGFREKGGADGGPLQLDGDQADRVQQYVTAHPELDAESKDELLKIKAVYADGKRQALLMKAFIDRLLIELKIPAMPSDGGFGGAVTAALQDPSSIQKAITKARNEMDQEGSKFDASSSMLRDLALILESLAGGGFSDLADKLVKAA